MKRWLPILRQALVDNAKSFSARPPEYFGHALKVRPLFVEMTFVDTSGAASGSRWEQTAI
jgi:hypothetical protein